MSTTVTIRPNSVVNGGPNDWTIFGGAGSELLAINDNSDVTGIQDVINSGHFPPSNPRFIWGSASVPGSAIVSQVQFVVRYSSTGTDPADFDFRCNPVISTSSPQQYAAHHPATPSGIANDTVTKNTRPDGAAWSPSDFGAGNISISIEQNYAIGMNAGTPIFVYDIWMNVTYDSPPSATVTAPTGNVLNPSPTVTWTYSDPDGDPQNAYRVRIFSAAQYGIGGFDPETSPNTWDSGVVASAGTSQVIGTALAAGDYRAYVKVSDATVGFGTWSFNSFTVVLVSMPGTGDLAATATTTTVATAILPGFGDLTANPIIFSGVTVRPTIGSKSPMLDDTKNRLGCGSAGAFITGKCGYPTVCVLDNISDVEWDRRLDDVSQATIKIGLSGGTDGACCECLNEIEPWCHELHITRNGVEQWCGPVTKVTYTFNEVIIEAIDMIGWLGVKIPAADSTFAVATNLTTIAYGTANSIFNVAMIEEPSCYLDAASFSAFPNAITGIRTYKAYGATSLEYLNDLAHSGLNYTTLGRLIVLSGEITQLTPLIVLRDEHILGDVEIVKDGQLAGNRYYVHYKNDLGVPAVYTHPTSYCYGKIEKMLTADSITTVANAQAMATSYANATFVAPRTVEIPAGSRLHPDTPWTISEMVCGARVDVQISGLCFKIEQSFTLNAMKLTETASEGEQVLITLVPINSVGIS